MEEGDFMNKSRILKELINSDETLIMPDAYNPLSAKLIEKAGFKAIQCSGYSFAVAAGYPDEIYVNLDENIQWTHEIVDSVNIPVMADAEDGYGGPEEVLDTVERFIEIGVAGLNLEDQILDGRRGVSVIDEDLMMEKIMVDREMAEIKNNNDFIINARTDALRSTESRDDGLEIAIDRVKQYLYAGADLAFITYVETMDEVEKITMEVKGPVSIAAGQSYNMKNFSIKDLQKCGVARVSLPTLLMNSCLFSMEKSLKLVKDDELHKINLN